MKITLESLLTLDAIVRKGSFAAAAAELHKAQSAVSYGVRQLESALGVSVFDRAGHRAVLTDAGRAILDESRAILARAKRLEERAGRFSEAWEPRFELVADGIVPMAPIMGALARMTEEGVPTILRLKVEFLGGVQDGFERDEADAMIVKDYVRGRGLVEVPLFEVPVVLVCAASHPLAHGTRSVVLADLHRHVELTVHDSSASTRLTDARLFGGARVCFLSDFSTKKQAILMGLGFGWMPEYLVRDELANGLVREVRYRGGSRYAFTAMFVYPASRPLGRAGQLLLDRIRTPEGEVSGKGLAAPRKRRRAKGLPSRSR